MSNKPYLPYDTSRCTGENPTSVCLVRDKCLRYLAEWRKHRHLFIKKPEKEPCEFFIEIDNERKN